MANSLDSVGVDVGLVAGVRGQRDAHRRQELLVGDVLLLRDDDPAGDLELVLLRQCVRQQADDPVVLAGEQGVGRGQRDVLVGPRVTGDDGAVAGWPAAGRRRSIAGAAAGVAAGGLAGQVAVAGSISVAWLLVGLPSSEPSRSQSSRALVAP